MKLFGGNYNMNDIDLTTYNPDAIVLESVPGYKVPVIITGDDAVADNEFQSVFDFINTREDEIGISNLIIDELGFDTLADYTEYISDNPNNISDLIMTVYGGLYMEDYRIGA